MVERSRSCSIFGENDVIFYDCSKKENGGESTQAHIGALMERRQQVLDDRMEELRKIPLRTSTNAGRWIHVAGGPVDTNT